MSRQCWEMSSAKWRPFCLGLNVLTPSAKKLFMIPHLYLDLTWTWSAAEVTKVALVNTLRLRQNGRHFPDDIFKCIFLNENVYILIKISLKFVPKGPIKNNPPSERMMASMSKYPRQGHFCFSESICLMRLIPFLADVPTAKTPSKYGHDL